MCRLNSKERFPSQIVEEGQDPDPEGNGGFQAVLGT